MDPNRRTHLGQISMSASKMGSVPELMFVSITGPALDKASAKAMRAHVTRANFARRRRRLVRDYANQKDHAMRLKPAHVEQDDLNKDRGLVIDVRLPMLSHPGVDRRLHGKDAFYISHCA